MEPSARGLDEVVDLLGRWSGASGSADRLQVVTEAARVLRDLQSTDSRVLARQLFEHGAPNAAQKIAQQTGGAVSVDQLNDAAYALLSVDQRELDGLARELRDPEERRRIFEEAGVSLRAATDTDAGTAPPDPTTRQDIPPPPGASPRTSASSTSSPETDTPRSSDVGDPPDAVHEAPSTTVRPAVTRRRPTTTPAARLVDALTSAANGRERLQRLDDHPIILEQDDLIDVLRALPDGWQRRTVLRRLLAAGQVRLDGDARQVVALFERRGDRFAAAAALTRSGRADVVPLLTELDPADARRLRGRYGPTS